MLAVTGGHWQKKNERMKEMGVEAFYQEQFKVSRY